MAVSVYLLNRLDENHNKKVCERSTFFPVKVYERATFSAKMVYKRVRGWTSGRNLHVLNFVK